ncbi:MAG: Phospho-N-acetylmuramoyl-pentapeptide-transferase [Parcubacteria group bacterium GW2011_GWC1_42_11]|uniref:Phospho-N-acetylmuramoyl-pentapeptide-transferase n=1 Tax=Candidatus Nomurabacteria bacterium GW2011_GWC2_42_20 TaxID=1618756 RepID=A0A0G1BL51_9BACT|nr:MAG: Phospho-N-acetylmuramoyl-pentapeptide-transferase [Parcubacteria group bacterium GW2011_GWC1_42_11]KKS47026.1 MAG: Phospho-N-acetylmuramoyl-pentapeptide-transferase [Candidatus Nomurabacteria bacterium GW2011_GWC2_42_20]KKS59231.1 MAG: Phospho-N-acetylmuramoyl-pentapeptide-transferase [Candidatus Nomurabacteria bacterium GW2011_GWA2_42_41]KKT09166.1 MAG: Phospho-N-acetylmuramoyl-pentapeptide-transferase [Candidatus Nomurabacteria bacterium GW2011_GWB1_43_20]TAN35495.1 MAG: hypothetical 
MPIDVVKILLPTAMAFFVGIAITPILTDFLYRHKMWKKSSVKLTMDGREATISSRLHNDEERKTPRMGGVVIWKSVFVTTFLFFLLSLFFPGSIFEKLSFLSRNQTWLPLFTLMAGGIFGLIDDYLVCREAGTYLGGGLSLRARLLFVFLLGAVGAWWFYSKLGMNSVHIPFGGDVYLGLWFIPLFIIFMIGIYSGGIIDGIDGLSGGVFASIFAAYAVIAFAQGQIDLAAFSSVVVGGLLAFLWFNIPPARFFNSETGTMALTTSLTVVAFLTNTVLVLPVIALLLIATSASSIIQIISKKYRNGKKVFLVAPLHNHFQAKGWPPYKVVMRYWVMSVVLAVIGTIIALVG